MDAIRPAIDDFATKQAVAAQREEELRRQQTTGPGFLFRIFNPLPLAVTTRSNGDDRPVQVLPNRRGPRRFPWARN